MCCGCYAMWDVDLWMVHSRCPSIASAFCLSIVHCGAKSSRFTSHENLADDSLSSSPSQASPIQTKKLDAYT